MSVTPEHAATLLYEKLRQFPWLTSIGVGADHGRPCLYVYVSSRRNSPELDRLTNWNGYKVIVRLMAIRSPRQH